MIEGAAKLSPFSRRRMALNDREYYREELARKRGIRSGGWRGAPPCPAAKLPQTAAVPTPLLDAIVANATTQMPAVAPARPPAAESETAPPAPALVVDADWPTAPRVPALRRRWPWRWRVRRWQQRVRRWRRRFVVACLVVALAVLPPLVTPRCSGLVTWRNSPVECWRYSAAVLVKRIAVILAAMRDDRVM